MGQIEHRLTSLNRDQRVLVLRECAAVRFIEGVADREPQNLLAR
jgi:hypothetical protein